VIRRTLAGIALLWLIGFLMFAISLPKAAGNEKTEAVVVLTGGEGRVQRGLDVLERRRAERLLISGVERDVTLKALAVGYHIPNDMVSCCVDLGKQARDTRSNAVETADWISAHHFRSVRIVTNNWHMRRALFELARVVSPTVQILPDAVEETPSISILFSEYDKYLLRRATLVLGA